MEERIIDDEYGRGIRLKKTKDGYVDVADELAEGAETEDAENEVGYDEVAFEFPDLEEDDEDLVSLSPEEAIALRKRKAEEAKARQEEYERYCEEGEKLLESGSFHAAELKFEKALTLDGEAVQATVGYWRAKTSDFAEPDVLTHEYLESGFENLEGDLGYKAVDELKARYKKVFKKRADELKETMKPIEQTVLEKREARREKIAKRMSKAAWRFSIALVPTLVALVLACVFGSKIFSTKHGEFIMPTIVTASLFVVGLIVTLVFTNKLLNTVRIHRANERDESTQEGRELIELRNNLEIYERFLEGVDLSEEEESTVAEEFDSEPQENLEETTDGEE
jgi:hypothetical protein